MPQVINTNVASLTSQRNLNTSQTALNTSLQRLSSGLRINSAKDDAAGLAISERMSSQVRGLNQASRNANDGISLAQTAEGALGEITNNLQRIRELAVQSANATNSSSDRAALQAEVSARVAEIDRVATQTQFNGMNLLDGSFNAQNFQVGANANQVIQVSTINSARSSSLGQYNGFNATNLAITGNDATSAFSITLNGPASTVSLGNVARDAKAIANAVNASGISGLTASADPTLATGTLAALSGSEANEALSITLNNTNISFNSGTTQATALSNLAAAVTAQSAQTGVTVTDTGSGLKFTAADGRNITFGALTGATTWTAGELGIGALASTTTAGTVDVSYQAPAGSAVTGVTFTQTGFTNTQTVATTGTALSAVDISTSGGATTALSALDAALSAVNSSRASLGAYQNRFESAIANLQTSAENLTASRSRIQDADFAAETATLSRNQIMQQAGTAMLAQANSLPQNVLSLLR